MTHKITIFCSSKKLKPLFFYKLAQNSTRMTVDECLNYANTLVGLPFRWFVPGQVIFTGDDAFWCGNSPAPTATEIKQNDKSIVCAGFPNLLRRFCGLTIPGLNGNIVGKHKKYYMELPGGTGAWFLYLYQRKRLQKIDLKRSYPKGTLLIARFKSDELDQGHLAVVYSDAETEGTLIRDQLVIHSSPDIDYANSGEHKNHGAVKIEPFHVGNNLWRENKPSYYSFVCLPEDWLLKD